jgi:outer membrane protein assembly factor BamA
MVSSPHRPFWQKAPLFLLGLTLIPFGTRAAPKPNYQGYRIEKIYVIRRQIFDTSIPSENKLAYRAINNLHISTKERAIRQQLLFKSGDLFQPKIAEETERAIRKILRLRDVHVRPVPVGDGKVDVLVETQDTWTTEPFIGVSGSGSETKYTVGIRERNLGGYGKEVGFIYKKEADLATRSFSYRDPALLGSRLRLSGDYADTAEGSSRSLILEKPFSSSLTRAGFKTNGSYNKNDVVLYEEGKEVNRYTQENREMGGGIAVSLGSTVKKIRRLGLGYRYLHERVNDTKDDEKLVRDDTYHYFGPSFEWQKVSFITVDHIRLYSREEDFNMGLTLGANVGVSQSRWVPGATNATFIQGQVSQGKLWDQNRFGLATVKEDGRYENGWKNAETRIDLEYYDRARSWTTWAGHLAWDQILHPDGDTQLLLGGTSGLRGYPVNAFAGNRLIEANLENRMFLVDNVFQFFGIGAVGFVDAGYAWPRGTSLAMKDIRASYGAGLRLHLSRASLGQVLRFDIAWPTRNTNGDRSPVFTFGTGQVF